MPRAWKWYFNLSPFHRLRQRPRQRPDCYFFYQSGALRIAKNRLKPPLIGGGFLKAENPPCGCQVSNIGLTCREDHGLDPPAVPAP